MRYGWAALGALCLLAFSVQAQETTLRNRYSQIQELNNESWRLMSAQPLDPQKLHKAVALLHESLADSAKLKSDLADLQSLDVDGRQWDAQFRLAKINAMLGDREQALVALEGLSRQDWVTASLARLIEGEHAFDGLHDDPRYQSVIAAFKRLETRWNAPAIATTSANLDEAQRIAGLSLFWSEARYNFVYFDHMPNLDWNQAYLEFLPKVIAAKNLHDYYDVMMQFAPLLHDGHTNIYPPEVIQNEFYARPPIRTALVDGHVLVTGVPSSALARQLRVGDEIVTIDGQDVRQYAQERVVPYVSSSTPQDALVRTYDYMLLAGDHRRPVTLGLRDGAGRMRQLTLSREPDASAKSSPAFEWRMLPNGVAYLAVNEFADDAGLKAFEREWPAILKAKGLILDVRRNGGGSTQFGQAILSYLSDKPIPAARMNSPEYVPVFRAWSGPSTHWHAIPTDDFRSEHDQHYAGPVVVLIGPRTFSAGEDFTMMFDAMKRGTLIGEATGGSTGQPLTFDLPGGGSARVCAKRDTYPDGREFVGKGIQPQITVAPTVEDIRAGRDPVLQRALAMLAGKPAPSATPAP